MRKAKCLLCTAMIAVLAMMQFPARVHAKEIGGGETTIHVHVPEAHVIQLRVGEHGALRINGKTYTGSTQTDVKRLTNPKFEIIADKGYGIEAVYYQNKDVTGELNENIYTAPAVYEDGNLFEVTFQKGPGNTGGDGGSSGGGNSSDGNGTTEGGTPPSGNGGNTSGNGDSSSGNGGSSSGSGNAGNGNAGSVNRPSDNGGGTGGSGGSGQQSGSKDEADKKEDGGIKDEILGELDKIDEQLKNENLTEKEKADLKKKKQELIQKMTNLISYELPNQKDAIENSLTYIERLLERTDLSEEQRQQLLKKQEELKNHMIEIEKAEKQKSLLSIGIGIFVIILIAGSMFLVYKKRKNQ